MASNGLLLFSFHDTTPSYHAIAKNQGIAMAGKGDNNMSLYTGGGMAFFTFHINHRDFLSSRNDVAFRGVSCTGGAIRLRDKLPN